MEDLGISTTRGTRSFAPATLSLGGSTVLFLAVLAERFLDPAVPMCLVSKYEVTTHLMTRHCSGRESWELDMNMCR